MNRSHGFFKRMITGLLSAAMILTAVPSYTFAAELNDDTTAESMLLTEVAQEPLEEPAEEPSADAGKVVVETSSEEKGQPETDDVINEDPDTTAGEEITDDNALSDPEDADELLTDTDEELVEEEVLEEQSDSEDELLDTGSATNFKVRVLAFKDHAGEFTCNLDQAVGIVKSGSEYYLKGTNANPSKTIRLTITPQPGYKVTNVYAAAFDQDVQYGAANLGCVQVMDFSNGSWSATLGDDFIKVLQDYSVDKKPSDKPDSWVRALIISVETEETTDRNISFDDGFDEKYTVKVNNKTVTNPVSVEDGNNFSFTLTGKNGYSVFGVYNGTPAEDDSNIINPVSGKYTVNSVDGDKDIKVITNVNVSASVDTDKSDDAGAFKLTYVSGTTQAGTPEKSYVSNNTDIKIRVDKSSVSTDLNAYKYFGSATVGSESPVTLESPSGTTFTIPATLVKSAQKKKVPITISFVAKRKTVPVVVAPDQKAKFSLYKVGTGPDSKEISTDTSNPTEVTYGEPVQVYVQADPYNVLKSIKAGSTTVQATAFKVDPGAGEKKYYEIPATAFKTDKQVILSAVTDVEPKDGAEITIVSSNCDVTVNKANATDGKWKLPNKTKAFTYTIETKGNYIVSEDALALYEYDEEKSAWKTEPVSGVKFDLSAPVLNKTKDGLLYTVTGIAAEYAGRKLEVKAVLMPRVLTVGAYTEGENKTSVMQGNTVIPGGGEYYLTDYDPFKTYDISLEPLTKLTKLNNKGDVNGKQVSAAKGKISTTAAIYKDVIEINGKDYARVSVDFGTDPVAALVTGNGILVNNDTYPGLIDTSKTWTFNVGYSPTSVTSVKATPANAVLDGFVTFDETEVSIDPAKVKDAGKTITLTVVGKKDKKAFSVSVKLNFKAVLNKVDIKGLNKDRELSQPCGTTASYTVSVNANADTSTLGVKIASDSEEENAVVSLSDDKKTLTVMTQKTDDSGVTSVALDPIKVLFTDGDNVISGQSITVNPVEPKLTAPAVTVTNISDIDMKLALALPKGITDESYSNMFYKVRAVADVPSGKTCADNMKPQTDIEYYPVNAAGLDALELRLAKDEIKMGEGQAQKYKIDVTLIQASMAKGDKLNDAFVVIAYATKTVTASTKEPAYEVKLGFTNMTTTFTQFETTFKKGTTEPVYDNYFVCAGMAKFSAATTWTSIDEEQTYIVDAVGDKYGVGNAVEDAIVIGADGKTVWLDTRKCCPGKATLYVAALTPSAAPVYVKVPITVKPAIKTLSVSPYADSKTPIALYKESGKAATLKFKADTYAMDGYDHYIKPSSNKVEWHCVLPEGSSLLGSVEIDKNNGTLTVKKDAVLDETPANNKIAVWASAADVVDPVAPYESWYTYVMVNSTSISVNGFTVSYDAAGKNTVSLTDLANGAVDAEKLETDGLFIKFMNGSKPIALNNLTFKLSSKDVRLIEDKNDPTLAKLFVDKAGQFTITATANDGAKSKADIKIRNKGAQVAGGKIGTLDLTGEVSAKDLEGQTVTFYKDKACKNEINYALYTIKADKGIELCEDTPGVFTVKEVTKKGTINITATSNDGSKSSYKIPVKVKGRDIASAKLGDKAIETSYDGKDLIGKTLVFFDSAEAAIPCNEVTYSATGLKVDDTGTVTEIKKPGKCSVTGKTRDGNATMKVEFEVNASDEWYEWGFFEADGKTPIIFHDFKATISNVDFIRCMVARKDSPFDYSASVSVDGGTIVSTNKWFDDKINYWICEYVIKPKSEVIEPTLKWVKGTSAQSLSCTITNNMGEKPALKLSKSSKPEFAGEVGQETKNQFWFESAEALPSLKSGESYRLVFQPGEAYYKSGKELEKTGYVALSDLLNKAAKTGTIATPLSGPTSFATALETYNYVPRGTYKFDVTLVKVATDNGKEVITPVTKPATVTFTSRAPKKLVAKLDTKAVTVENIKDKTGTIGFAASSVFSTIDSNVKVYNNNDKGKINNFTSLFDVECTNEGVTVTRTDKEYKGGFDSKGQATIIGWVEYTATAEDGESTVTNLEKVTVTLQVAEE